LPLVSIPDAYSRRVRRRLYSPVMIVDATRRKMDETAEDPL
jgi:hypothetical protein